MQQCETINPNELRRLSFTSPTARSREAVEAALRKAAEKIEEQERQLALQAQLIGEMRVGLQPYAIAAPSWQGPDDTVIVDGRGHQIKLGHFRRARKLWSTRLSTAA